MPSPTRAAASNGRATPHAAAAAAGSRRRRRVRLASAAFRAELEVGPASLRRAPCSDGEPNLAEQEEGPKRSPRRRHTRRHRCLPPPAFLASFFFFFSFRIPAPRTTPGSWANYAPRVVLLFLRSLDFHFTFFFFRSSSACNNTQKRSRYMQRGLSVFVCVCVRRDCVSNTLPAPSSSAHVCSGVCSCEYIPSVEREHHDCRHRQQQRRASERANVGASVCLSTRHALGVGWLTQFAIADRIVSGPP